jgi:hypothetical protein
MKLITTFCMAVSLMTIGCGDLLEKVEDSQTAAGTPIEPIDPFLTKADIAAPATMEKISEASMKEILFSLSALENNPIEYESGKCLDAKLNSSIISATENKLTYSGNIAMVDCVNTSKYSLDLDLTKDSLKWVMILECEEVDLSVFDGKESNVIVDNPINIKGCKTGSIYKETFAEMHGSLQGTIDGVTITMPIHFEMTDFHGMPDMTACMHTEVDGVDKSSGCVEIKKTAKYVLDDSGNETEVVDYFDYSTITQVDVVGSDDAHWYDSGTATVAINDWTGEVVYAGGTSAPTYEMKNGDSLTSTGKVVPTLNLSGATNKLKTELANTIAKAVSASQYQVIDL